MSRPTSTLPSSAATPDPSSPPASESYLSELDGTAPSFIGTSADFAWDARHVDPTALNLVSWKLDVNARAEDGVDKRGFNAISTVLNHPTKKANPLRASRKPLPPLAPPPPVPKPPPPSHYDAYLKSITPLYEGFIAAQASSSTSPATSDLDIRSPEPSKVNLPPLESVPASFFDPSFDLAIPTTWTAVVDGEGAGQDSLSTYLDTLERHLIHEITLRSSSFFSALNNLQDLHSESTYCLSRITELQGSLQEVGTKQARKGLEILDKQDELSVLRVTEGGIRSVGELEELVRVTKGLVEAGDWAGGLGCLGDVVRWWERHALLEDQKPATNGDIDMPSSPTSPSLPLSTLPALSQLPSALSDLTASIASQMETALTSLLLSVLAQADSEKPLDKTGFRGSMEPMLVGLARCGKVEGVEDVWREVMTTSIREGSRKHLPAGQTEDDGEDEGRPPEARGSSLAQSLRAMDHSRFLLLSTQMYGSMLSRLHLAQQVGQELAEVLTDVTYALHPLAVMPLTFGDSRSIAPLTIASFLPDQTPLLNPKPKGGPKLDLSDVLSSACELANSRASKILAVRSEQHAALSLTEFVEIFKENWEFVLATETLANRMIVSLRGVTASQARSFLVSYHAIRLTQSARLVEEEQWTQIDVSWEIQHTVNLLIDSAVSDPPECAIPPHVSPQTDGDTSQPDKVMKIEEKTFFVVKATADSLVLLADYLSIVINLELVVTDVMSRIIEFLKSFNSRTCQVVLGAGAMRSAGLKNITAKHLALASQSLSAVVALIPYIREFIRRHLNPKQAVMLTEFDKLKRDYQEHQNEIHAKLVAIMSDRLAVHCSALRAIDWEAASDKDGVRPYAEMLIKETATLHKVLSKYLAQQTVEGVMSEVLAAIVHRLSEEYAKVDLKSDDAKKRMSQDVAQISSRLSPLSEAGKTVTSLETLVKDKPTPRRPMGQTMAGLLRKASVGPGVKKLENGDKMVTKEAGGEDGAEEDEDGVGMVPELAPTDKANGGEVVASDGYAEAGVSEGAESSSRGHTPVPAGFPTDGPQGGPDGIVDTVTTTPESIRIAGDLPNGSVERVATPDPPLPLPRATEVQPSISISVEPPEPLDKAVTADGVDDNPATALPDKDTA